MTDKTKDPVALALENVIEEVCVQLRDKSRDEYGPSWYPGTVYASDLADRLETALQSIKDQQAQPVDIVLHCPKCGKQHIDEPDTPKNEPHSYREENGIRYPIMPEPKCTPLWTNPPHRSHLCHGCGHIWRPADVPTNGVAAIKTKGKADSAPVDQQAHGAMPEYCWLVELRPAFPHHPHFEPTYYAGWMEDPLEAAKTFDVYATPRFTRKEDAERVANKLGHTISCIWTAVEHGFDSAPQPSPMPYHALLHSIAESARCLGVAQQRGDTDAAAYWSAKIDELCRCAPASNTGKEQDDE